jgi:DNA (cytosine-5)-methyltransferase 1
MLIREIIVDNFAGGGGASSGIEMATGRSVDAAINHDMDAINMHKMNHPDTDHYCESVFDVDPIKVAAGRPVALGWFSPDCKHFSKAKGGKPLDQKIRGLAWVAHRWALLVRPRVIMLENVEEFQTWGPLNEEGRACTLRKGSTFRAFVQMLGAGIPPEERHNNHACSEIKHTLGLDKWQMHRLVRGLGYQVEWRELRACDYGAGTSRKRLFLVARCDGQPIVWPKPTHRDPRDQVAKKHRLPACPVAADFIDWSIPCPSIFSRKKPLAENTLKRIARGLERFIINNPDPFIVPGGAAPFITEFANASNQRNMGADEPLRTICAQVKGGHFALVSAFLAKHYGGGYTGPGASLEAPLPTVTTVDHNALVTSHLVKLRGTCKDGQPVTEPMPTVTAGGLHIGEVRAFLLKYYGTNIGHDCRDPLQTITTKHRFGLVTIHGQDYQIVDIGMRMLVPRELFNASSFPPDYIIDVTPEGKKVSIKAQVARVGNAVPPYLAKALVQANLPELCIERKEEQAA